MDRMLCEEDKTLLEMAPLPQKLQTFCFCLWFGCDLKMNLTFDLDPESGSASVLNMDVTQK